MAAQARGGVGWQTHGTRRGGGAFPCVRLPSVVLARSPTRAMTKRLACEAAGMLPKPAWCLPHHVPCIVLGPACLTLHATCHTLASVLSRALPQSVLACACGKSHTNKGDEGGVVSAYQRPAACDK